MPAVTLRLLEAESGEDFGHLTDEAQALLSGGKLPRRGERPTQAIDSNHTLGARAKRHLRDVGAG